MSASAKLKDRPNESGAASNQLWCLTTKNPTVAASAMARPVTSAGSAHAPAYWISGMASMALGSTNAKPSAQPAGSCHHPRFSRLKSHAIASILSAQPVSMPRLEADRQGISRMRQVVASYDEVFTRAKAT
jgi:hypothetical protein